MIRRHLIVRGVRTTDQLQQLGLPMARRYEQADVVALVGNDGRGMIVKGAEDTVVVELFDADPSAGRCMRAVRRVKDTYERDNLPVVGWGTETVVGMFLYYWPIDLDLMDMVADAIERGDGEAVERAADAFIATDYGTNLSALGTLRADANSHDAAGHAAGNHGNRADGATG